LALKSNIDRHLDLRGTIPPISLLKIRQVFRAMRIDETIEVIGRDPDTRRDVFKIMPPSTYELIASEDMDYSDSSYRIVIKKKEDL